MKTLLLIPLLLCSCSISKFNQPPGWASTVIIHGRQYGLKAKIPLGSTSVMEVLLGWGSETVSIIPVSTNKIYASPVSDTFKLGQGINPFNTTITEDLQTGWEGQPPPPRLKFVVPIESGDSIATNWPFLDWETNSPPLNRR